MNSEQNEAASSGDQYDENTIISLVLALYQALIEIGGIDESDVIWAPPEGHKLDISKLGDDSRIDTRIVSLMQKLPIIQDRSIQILPLLSSVDYHSGWCLARSRSIDYIPQGLNTSNALPTVMMLFGPVESDDDTVLLDITDNTVRIMHGPVYPPHTYLDIPTQHAPTYLQSMLDKYYAGYLVPDMRGTVEEIGPSGSSRAQEVHRTLTEDYGWPNAFDRDAWKRDAQDHVDRYQHKDFIDETGFECDCEICQED